MGKKLIGVVLLIGGIFLALFGFLYNNSAQHQMMSMVNGFTGSSSDSTGTIAIVIGVISSIVGAGLLVVSGSTKQQ